MGRLSLTLGADRVTELQEKELGDRLHANRKKRGHARVNLHAARGVGSLPNNYG
jgi:hypothetical protein